VRSLDLFARIKLQLFQVLYQRLGWRAGSGTNQPFNPLFQLRFTHLTLNAGRFTHLTLNAGDDVTFLVKKSSCRRYLSQRQFIEIICGGAAPNTCERRRELNPGCSHRPKKHR
jgi:hypothetical protein